MDQDLAEETLPNHVLQLVLQLRAAVSGCSLPGWSQNHVGRHLRKEWDDGSPEIQGPVLASHVTRFIVLGGDLHCRVIGGPR